MPFKKSKKAQKELLEEEREEQFWDEVDELAQKKIYKLLVNNIPLPGLKLITESWRYEDKQSKLTGLFLHQDVDYRTLLGDIENQYDEENLPDKEYLAEEVAVWYYRIVIKALISDLSELSSFDSSQFENLSEE